MHQIKEHFFILPKDQFLFQPDFIRWSYVTTYIKSKGNSGTSQNMEWRHGMTERKQKLYQNAQDLHHSGRGHYRTNPSLEHCKLTSHCIRKRFTSTDTDKNFPKQTRMLLIQGHKVALPIENFHQFHWNALLAYLQEKLSYYKTSLGFWITQQNWIWSKNSTK